MGYKLICYDKDEEMMFLTKQFPSVYVNNTVSKIGANAFQSVSTIKSMIFTEAIEVDAGAFYRCEAEYFSFPKLESIGSYAFGYCSNVKDFVFPEVTYVGGSAFQYCNADSLTILKLSYLGDYAFTNYNDNGIKSITLSGLSIATSNQFSNLYHTENLTLYDVSIASYYTFGYFGGSLSSNTAVINVPDLEFASGQAFAYCYKLSKVNAPKLKTLGSSAFYYDSGLTEVNMPLVEIVSSSAFVYCSSLLSANLPNCTTLGESAFAYCYSLSEVNLPECSSAGSYIFYNCSSLSSFKMPKLKRAQYGLVGYCQTLSEIYLDTIEQFDNFAIYAASNLTALHMSQISSVPVVTSYYFISTCDSLAHIYVPSSLVTDFLNDTNWAFYSSIISGIY